MTFVELCIPNLIHTTLGRNRRPEGKLVKRDEAFMAKALREGKDY